MMMALFRLRDVYQMLRLTYVGGAAQFVCAYRRIAASNTMRRAAQQKWRVGRQAYAD